MRSVVFTTALASLVMLSVGCSVGGGGVVGNSPTGNLDDSIATGSGDFQVIDLVDGSVDARASITDLTTNAAYRDRFVVFRRVNASSPSLGSPSGTLGAQSDEVPSSPSVPAFYLAVFELTQGQWARLATTTPWTSVTPSGVGGASGTSLPAYGISRVAALAAIAGRPFALPSNTQWETAALAGAATVYAWGDSPLETAAAPFARVAETSSTTGAATVAGRAANAYGFFDMAGNVWEHTADGDIRGGSWADTIIQARPANRVALDQSAAHALVGVRLIYVP